MNFERNSDPKDFLDIGLKSKADKIDRIKWTIPGKEILIYEVGPNERSYVVNDVNGVTKSFGDYNEAAEYMGQRAYELDSVGIHEAMEKLIIGELNFDDYEIYIDSPSMIDSVFSIEIVKYKEKYLLFEDKLYLIP